YGRIRVDGLIEARARIDRREGPGFGLRAVPRRVHELVVIAAEAEDRGRVEGIGGAARIGVAIALAAAVGNEEWRAGGIRHSYRRAENLSAAGNGELVVHVIVHAVGEVLVRILRWQGYRIVLKVVVSFARPIGFPKRAQV